MDIELVMLEVTRGARMLTLELMWKFLGLGAAIFDTI